MEATATFTKLRNTGTWGIRSTVKIASGDEVRVTKKDGSTPRLKVDQIVWEGNGVWLATIAKEAPKPRKSKKVHAPFPAPINEAEVFEDKLIEEGRAYLDEYTPW